jgi:hypothetical protein
MSKPYVVITVEHGSDSLIGEPATFYSIALTTNGKDRIPTGLGPYASVQEAYRQANKLERSLEAQQEIAS